MPDVKEQPLDLVQVTLKKRHTHGGKDYKEGDTLKLRRDQVKRLEAKGKV
jgi:hypothetical protein